MHFRGVSVREIPCMLFLGLLFAVTVGWWVFLTLTVSVVFGTVAAAVFAVFSSLSVTVGYGLVRACLFYPSPSPLARPQNRMPSSP